jgi:hypothetical protein
VYSLTSTIEISTFFYFDKKCCTILLSSNQSQLGYGLYIKLILWSNLPNSLYACVIGNKINAYELFRDLLQWAFKLKSRDRCCDFFLNRRKKLALFTQTTAKFCKNGSKHWFLKKSGNLLTEIIKKSLKLVIITLAPRMTWKRFLRFLSNCKLHQAPFPRTSVSMESTRLPIFQFWNSKDLPPPHTHTPGVVVMITIFCDFWPIFGEKISVFLKNLCYDQNFAKTISSLSKKCHFFSKCFI